MTIDTPENTIDDIENTLRDAFDATMDMNGANFTYMATEVYKAYVAPLEVENNRLFKMAYLTIRIPWRKKVST